MLSDSDSCVFDPPMVDSKLAKKVTGFSGDEVSDQPALCLACGEIFNSQLELYQHQMFAIDSLCNESSSHFLNKSLISSEVSSNECIEPNNKNAFFPSSKISSSLHRPRSFQNTTSRVCELCYKMFTDDRNLTQHLFIHWRSNFRCSYCLRRFGTRSHLLGHSSHMHSSIYSDGLPLPCHTCLRRFSTYCVLRLHIRSHSGYDKPFSCPTCGQHFAKNIHLKRHISTHTGLKPHECEICGKHFSRSDHLKRHVQSLHSDYRPHACGICKKAFVRKYELIKHLHVHSNLVEPAAKMSAWNAMTSTASEAVNLTTEQ